MPGPLWGVYPMRPGLTPALFTPEFCLGGFTLLAGESKFWVKKRVACIRRAGYLRLKSACCHRAALACHVRDASAGLVEGT